LLERELKKLLINQLIITSLLPLLLIPFGIVVAKSAFFGGLVALVATLISSLLASGKYRAQQTGRILAKFYLAELVKFAIIALGFGLVFWAVQPINVMALLAVFFITQVIPAVFLGIR
jgi:ATP synthase protein I